MKTIYRLVLSTNKSQDVIIELLKNSVDDTIINKLKDGVLKETPWRQCVPYFRNSLLYFQNLNCLKYFLFNVCKLSLDDVLSLEDKQYILEKCLVNSYAKGQSTLYYNIDLEEIDESEFISINEIFKSSEDIKYNIVKYNSNIFNEDVKYCKEMYYKQLLKSKTNENN